MAGGAGGAQLGCCRPGAGEGAGTGLGGLGTRGLSPVVAVMERPGGLRWQRRVGDLGGPRGEVHQAPAKRKTPPARLSGKMTNIPRPAGLQRINSGWAVNGGID